VFPAEPVVPAPCIFIRTGAAGISRYPAFPAPSRFSEGLRSLQSSGENGRENAGARLAPGRRGMGCLTMKQNARDPASLAATPGEVRLRLGVSASPWGLTSSRAGGRPLGAGFEMDH
jgi:hypothetical protein